MKKHLLIAITFFLALNGSSILHAQSVSKVGRTAAPFLTIPVGARSSAMTANVASVNDASAMFWNPAGLSDINNTEIMFEYTDWFLDFSHTFFGAAVPVGKGSVGFHVIAFDMGQFEETTVEAGGLTGRTFGAYSVSTGLSFSQYLIPEFTIGGTAKFVYERISNNSASNIAFDLGTIYQTPFDDIKLGVSITNLGSKMSIAGNDNIVPYDPIPGNLGEFEPDAELVTEEFEMPLALRVGIAWEAFDEDGTALTLAVDGTSPADNQQSVSVGGELSLLEDQFFIRGGLPYIGLDTTTETFNAGLGVNYRINEQFGLRINYSYHGFRYLNNVSKISLHLEF